MTMLAQFAAAGGGALPSYIEDVFSTYLYTGNSSTQTITNGIDLAGKGGLVWLKARSEAANHGLVDTVRGVRSYLSSDSTAAAYTNVLGYDVTAFNANGFSLGPSQAVSTNTSGQTYASWTFREQPKFFDVVTYTGDGTDGRSVAHSLGVAPKFIIIKCTSDAGTNWVCGMTGVGSSAYIQINLNSTDAGVNRAYDGSGMLSAAPTSTDFKINQYGFFNGAGRTYVAYLFAHDAGGFGLSGNENVVSCGSYTGNGSTSGPTVTLGYEPQWLLVKNATTVGNWFLMDNMRGIPMSGDTAILKANTSAAEDNNQGHAIELNATGFQVTTSFTGTNGSGDTLIYIAIRRGPMKVPTDGTTVFSPNVATTQILTNTVLPSAGFPVDLMFFRKKDDAYSTYWNSRLLPDSNLQADGTGAEITGYPYGFDSMTSVKKITNNWYNGSAVPFAFWQFRRAPKFFDQVCYTGTGSATFQNLQHNLTVVPEMMIVKARSYAEDSWIVYHSALGNTQYLQLNAASNSSTASLWNNTTPTASVFTVGNNTATNNSGATYVNYLFATCPGVSKVGSYTGTGTTLAINCGFTAGARFVLIKRTDSTGDWYYWDSARGIVAGDDPYLLLNSTAAEVTSTDYVDTSATGFELTSTAPAAINASGGSFIFLAIS